MSWFNQFGQNQQQQQQQQQQPTDSPSNPAASMAQPGFPSPCLEDFPSAPQSVYSPPRLDTLSCASSPSSGPVTQLDSEPISYVTLQEQRCVLSWFQGWTSTQKEHFQQDLVGKAVPGKVCTILDSLSTLQVKDRLPNIFECQLRLWSQWFESWGEEERNHFLHILEERDPVFVSIFYKSVAGTAGRD